MRYFGRRQMRKHPQHADESAGLLYHARAATPFCSPDGEPCASIPAGIDARRVVPLRSAAFRDWITANYYSEFEAAPSPLALQAALRALEARARYGESPAQKVGRRLSFEGDPYTPSKIILDLATSAGETLEITSRGWNVANNLSHSFFQSPATLPLPHPAEPPASSHQTLSGFSQLFRLQGATRTRVLTWLVNALRPNGPYPILVIQGPASSGKSTLARALRALVDPSSAPLRRLPARGRELLDLARQNWILVFDQVRRVPPNISDALCALSAGEAVEISQPDSREPLVFELARPMILVAPDDDPRRAWTPPHSLAYRTLEVSLPLLHSPRPEAEPWAALEALRPALLGSLATAVSAGLRNLRETDVGNVARFPDCAAWAAAAAPALGLEQNEIVEAVSVPSAGALVPTHG